MNELVVFSQVRWHVVCQRPQQILSRLARRYRILFVEEPKYAAGDPRGALHAPQNGITVLTPHTPLTAPGFHDDQLPLLQKLVERALAREGFRDYGAWLYTPMALPLLQKLSPRIIVYDCMHELTAYRGAPRQLVQRENALMRVANVVIAADPSLYEARRTRHPNVHLVPSSVDREHFARGADPAHAHPAMRALSRPRLGYVGVLDERLDFALLRALAERRPDWQICLVGPMRDVARAALPYLPNVHYFGHRRYAELPAFLAGLDVALLPFAQSDATRCVGPATALECLAAERPIVATPAGDVKRLYAHVVRLGATPDAFIAACDAALVESPAARAARGARMRRIVGATSWDETARQIAGIVERASVRGLTEAARTMLEPARPPRPPRSVPSLSRAAAPCVIVGAGVTGLAAAYHYGEGALLLEREARVGGGCRSIEDTGFTFDYGGHVMFSDDPYVQDLYRLLLGDNVHWQEPEAWVYRRGVCTRYPFQGALPPCDREQAIDASSSPMSGPREPGARFGYPLHGGFQALVDGFLPLLQSDLLLEAAVVRISPLMRQVTLKDGSRIHFDTLISTLPLPELVAALGDEAPVEVRRAAAELRHVSLRCVNLGVARPRLSDKHWIDFPEDAIFRRVFLQGNASPHCNPPGGFGLTCEITHSPTRPLPATGAALTARCIEDCIRVGLLEASDALLTSNQVDLPYAYVVHDHGRAERVAKIRAWLANFDILLAGRYGEWEHYEADQAFAAGKKAAEAARRLATMRVAAKTA